MSDFFTKTHCDRCGNKFIIRTQSIFNSDVLCRECLGDERKAPGYAEAARIESKHVSAGDYNYEGVGLSQADRDFLKLLRDTR